MAVIVSLKTSVCARNAYFDDVYAIIIEQRKEEKRKDETEWMDTCALLGSNEITK